MTDSSKRICIVGERGLVSHLLQAALAHDGRFSISVVSTETVLQSNSAPEIVAADLVVLCTLEFSSPQVVLKLPPSARILDISPAFRVDPDWVYGMPELPQMRHQIEDARRVSNPGCFATAAILALQPLVLGNVLPHNTQLYLDGTGGYTAGGGSMIKKEAAGELAAESVYSLTREHRHIPEIKRYAGLAGPVMFSPKIAQVPRGIRMMVPLFGIEKEAVRLAYTTRYAGTQVQVEKDCPSKIPVDDWANRKGACLRVIDQPGGCLVICTLDNLGKGAVDSALENILLMLSSA